MKRHLKYLSYVLRHKWYVLKEGLRLGVPIWQLIIHDWSKFLPGEWFPYSCAFYKRDGESQYVPTPAFWKAWNSHQKRHKHHWQYWVLMTDSGDLEPLEIPDNYKKEMLADWRGAGQALGKPNTWEWYEANRFKMLLHPDTRWWAEAKLSRQCFQYYYKSLPIMEAADRANEWLERCWGCSVDYQRQKRSVEEYAQYYFNGWKAKYETWYNHGGPMR